MILKRKKPTHMQFLLSGDYFSKQTIRFHHTVQLECFTLLKARIKSIVSVSVVAETCAIVDGLATAAVSFNTVNETKDFLERIMYENPTCCMDSVSFARNGELIDTISNTSELIDPVKSNLEQDEAMSRENRVETSEREKQVMCTE